MIFRQGFHYWAWHLIWECNYQPSYSGAKSRELLAQGSLKFLNFRIRSKTSPSVRDVASHLNSLNYRDLLRVGSEACLGTSVFGYIPNCLKSQFLSQSSRYRKNQKNNVLHYKKAQKNVGNFDENAFGPGYNGYRNEFAISDLSCMKMLLPTELAEYFTESVDKRSGNAYREYKQLFSRCFWFCFCLVLFLLKQWQYPRQIVYFHILRY